MVPGSCSSRSNDDDVSNTTDIGSNDPYQHQGREDDASNKLIMLVMLGRMNVFHNRRFCC